MNPLSRLNYPVFSVKSLVGELRSVLESNYRQIVVEGEISGLARPASGHLYFSLKEGNSLIRCAFFRNRRMGSSEPEEGMLVQVRGQVSLYESRGDLQLIIHKLQPAGEGALQRAFELLKKKLLAEGLFDSAHKKPLPEIPRRMIPCSQSDNLSISGPRRPCSRVALQGHTYRWNAKRSRCSDYCARWGGTGGFTGI